MSFTAIERFFGSRIFVINREARTDRWAHVKAMMAQLGITTYRRFNAHEPVVTCQGLPDGNAACVSSHRDLVAACGVNEWPNMLVLEDDFSVLPLVIDGIDQSTQNVFFAATRQLPENWDMLYLGGGYGADPQYRENEWWVRVNRMMTTSSYAISGAFAKRISRYIQGHGPIDSLFGDMATEARMFCITPRLFAQWTSRSDLTNMEIDYTPSMTDPRHEDMLISGEWKGCDVSTGEMRFVGPLQRKELAGRQDMNGSIVIVGRERFEVIDLLPLDHPAPWRKGERVEYLLRKERQK